MLKPVLAMGAFTALIGCGIAVREPLTCEDVGQEEVQYRGTDNTCDYQELLSTTDPEVKTYGNAVAQCQEDVSRKIICNDPLILVNPYGGCAQTVIPCCELLSGTIGSKEFAGIKYDTPPELPDVTCTVEE